MSNLLSVLSKDDLQKRNFGLDLVRCLAILMVLIAHTLMAFYDKPADRGFTLYMGVMGVDLFFVLSGFLIGTILIKIHSQKDTFNFKKVKDFWIRRWFRTLPNYFMVFIIYIIVFRLYSLQIPYEKLPLYIVFLQTTFTHNQWFYGVSWSLSVEEWFYLLFPIGILFFEQFLKAEKKKTILYTILTCVIACLFLRTCFSLFAHDTWDDGFRKQMPFRLDSISIGVLAATLKFYNKEFWDAYKNKLVWLGICLFTVLSTVMYFSLLKNMDTYSTFFMNTLFFPLMSIAIAMLLPYAYSIKMASAGIIKYIVTYISIISYSIYLIHPIFSYLIPHYFAGKLPPLVMATMLWVVTIIASHLIYTLFERRITVLRNQYSNRNEPIAALSLTAEHAHSR